MFCPAKKWCEKTYIIASILCLFLHFGYWRSGWWHPMIIIKGHGNVRSVQENRINFPTHRRPITGQMLLATDPQQANYKSKSALRPGKPNQDPTKKCSTWTELNRVTWTIPGFACVYDFWPNHFLKAGEQFKPWSAHSSLRGDFLGHHSAPATQWTTLLLCLWLLFQFRFLFLCRFLWQVKNLLMPSSAARSTCYNFYFYFHFHFPLSSLFAMRTLETRCLARRLKILVGD